MVDNCGTFLDAADHLVNKCGAAKVYIIATHGVLSGDSVERIQNCDSVYKLVVTNTFPIPKEKKDKASNQFAYATKGALLLEMVKMPMFRTFLPNMLGESVLQACHLFEFVSC